MPEMKVLLNPEQAKELGRCYASPSYFINRYCQILDAVEGQWVPFSLWKEQEETLRVIRVSQLVVMLKARQIGMTWLVLAFALWLIIFRPVAVILLFSRRDTEATYLLGSDRLRGMWLKLPDWMKSGHKVTRDSGHEWGLDNGSVARAFSPSSGDSYSATLAIVDEADLIPDLNRLMRAVKPTIDNGGQMILLSRPDKRKPVSEFKNIYKGAAAGQNGWAPVFLPWSVHPSRSPEWYREQERDILSRTGSKDDLFEQYPGTVYEALAPRTQDKRIPFEWLTQVFEPLDEGNPIGMPGLKVFRLPEPGRRYVIGGDPAEGNPTSDDSAATVLDRRTGEEVASLGAKLQPATFAACLDILSTWYNGAQLLVERNNHGHAVLLWLADNSTASLLPGHDGKVGWLSSSKGKALMYSDLVEAIRNEEVKIRTEETYMQLASIEGSTLLAPEGEHDDRADSFAIAWQASLTEGWAMA